MFQLAPRDKRDGGSAPQVTAPAAVVHINQKGASSWAPAKKRLWESAGATLQWTGRQLRSDRSISTYTGPLNLGYGSVYPQIIKAHVPRHNVNECALSCPPEREASIQRALHHVLSWITLPSDERINGIITMSARSSASEVLLNAGRSRLPYAEYPQSTLNTVQDMVDEAIWHIKCSLARIQVVIPVDMLATIRASS